MSFLPSRVVMSRRQASRQSQPAPPDAVAAARATPERTGADLLLNAGNLPGNPGNSGGKKGRSGRPPKAFKLFCADVLVDTQFQARLKRVAKNPDHKHYPQAVKLLVEQHEGKPAQQVVVSGSIDVTQRYADARSRLADRLRRLAPVGDPASNGARHA